MVEPVSRNGLILVIVENSRSCWFPFTSLETGYAKNIWFTFSYLSYLGIRRQVIKTFCCIAQPERTQKASCSEDTDSTLPQTIALLMSRIRAAHSKPGYPEASISFETQVFSSLVSAPMCEHRAENKSVTEKAAPWITRPEATRNTFRVFLPSLLRRKCWQISSSGQLHPKATLDSFDLQTALSSAICGFLCTLTPPAWIHQKNIPPQKHTSFCLLLPTLLPVVLYTALLCGLCVF